MSQAHRIANLDRNEYIDPHLVCAMEMRQLNALSHSMGSAWALGLLLAASNGKGSGDFTPVSGGDGPEPVEPEEHTQALLNLVGRWAGDRIAVIGDYFDGECEAEQRTGLDPQGLWKAMSNQDGWTDISEHVRELIELDENTKAWRHEVHQNPRAGNTWTEADGFEHARALPSAPRSILHSDGTIEAIEMPPAIDPTSLPTEADPLNPAQLSRLIELLDRATTGMGAPLDDDNRAEIARAATHPNMLTWQTVAHRNVAGGVRASTLWSLMLLIDPTFPQSCPRNDVGEAMWPKIPSGAQILAALEMGVEGRRAS